LHIETLIIDLAHTSPPLVPMQANTRKRPTGIADSRSRHLAPAFLWGIILVTGPVKNSCGQVVDQAYPRSVPGYDDQLQASVILRPQPDYDPVPIRIGDFLLRPELDESAGYDSDATGRRPADATAVVTSQPSVRLNSDFGRDAFGAALILNDTRTLDIPRQDQTDVIAAVGGTYDIGRDALTIAGSHLALHEDQTEINSAGLDRPLAFDVDDIRARYVTEFARWTFKPTLEYVRYRFDDVTAPGALLSQNTQDRNTEAAGLTVGYAIIPERSIVVRLRAVNTGFTGDYGGFARPNSTAYEALAGTDYAFSGNLRLVALAGYENRHFRSSDYPDRSEPVARASAIWTPTGLTTLSGNFSRTIEDVLGATTTGVTITSAGTSVDHEYRRNWLLHGELGLQHAAYAGASSETLYSAGLAVTYLANRHLHIGASYSFTSRTGGTIDAATLSTDSFGQDFIGDYNRHILLLRVSVFP
jgi:hypothetical protein